MNGLQLELSGDFLEALAQRVAAIVAAQLEAPSSPRWLTADRAAEYLSVPVKRIYNLTSRGEIPHRKQDGRLLFRRDELDAWLDQFYVGPDWAGPGALGDL